MPPEIKINYVNASDSEKRLQLAYSRIFDIARGNLIQRKKLKKGGDKHGISNSSRDTNILLT
jgi:hypothetical protein